MGSGIPSRFRPLLLAVVLVGCTAAAEAARPGTKAPETPVAKAAAEVAVAVATPALSGSASYPAKVPREPAPLPKSPSTAGTTLPASEVRLMFVGDVSLGWEAGKRIVSRGPHVPWRGVAGIFADADLVAANLECAISARGAKWPTKNITIRAPLAAADSLAVGGVDIVSLANNHALDFGYDAFRDTLRELDESGVLQAGGGLNKTEAYAPLIVEQNGLRIAFLAYVLPFSSRPSFNTRDWAAVAGRPGIAIGTPEVVGREVAEARSTADVVVVMVHGGTEYSHRPTKRQRAFAQAALDAGAALVVGHHPHVLQGYKRGAGTLVAFSLGNFVFDRFTGDANDSAILDVKLTSAGVASFRWIPVVIERGFPRPATGAEIQRIMRKLPAL